MCFSSLTLAWSAGVSRLYRRTLFAPGSLIITMRLQAGLVSRHSTSTKGWDEVHRRLRVRRVRPYVSGARLGSVSHAERSVRAAAVRDRRAWKPRAEYLRQHVLASAGLLPLPEKTPLRASVFGEITHADYTVSKVYFESLPGFFVTGNLYRPIGDGPFPAILSPHGHWAYGRLENTAINSGPGRAINLARQGFVVFTYDMVGYNDSQQLPHTFGGRRENLWGLSLGGLQLWNSIRALDFLETLPVRAPRRDSA